MIGRSVASYEILETLGEGGMGVVYKARDVRLERFVALKFIKPEGITAERRNRFFQEAKSISALNHPNIVHVYDIGQWDGADYIAMEYVEGVTLQNFLAAERLSINQALNFAIQISDAIAAAHEAGIVHRDLKPGNILITGRKRVKVVDFGLAKLVDPDISGENSSASSETQTALVKPVYTVAGMIVGSLAYMSPEQAEGKRIDGRSDIFAFGLVLYEMLAGRPAFSGSKFEVLSAIVNEEPKQLLESSPEIIPELEWIVARCLRKDPERRFQRMAEVRAALEDLRAESSSSGTRKAASSSQIAPPVLAPPAIQRHRQRRWLIWASLVVLACAFAAVFSLTRHTRTEREMPALVRLTTESGLNIDPAISPDGKFLAYASDRGGKGDLDIWVRQIGGSGAVQLTQDPADDDEPAFSPDGTLIAFHSNRDGGGLYIMPALGGAARKVADGGRDPRFSPDGEKIVYWSGPKIPYPLRTARPQMFVADLATSATHRLRSDFVAAVQPIWSPDGQHILFHGLQRIDASDQTDDWWVTPLDGGPAKPFGHLMTNSAPRLWAWHGNTLYLTDDAEPPQQVEQIEVDLSKLQPVGTPKRMTTSTTTEDTPSVSRDGRLVFTSLMQNTDLYEVPLQARPGQAATDPVRLTRDEGEDLAGSVSANGSRIAFSSWRTGNEEVWTRDMNAGQDRQLTYGGTRPRIDSDISPNGELVAWRENFVESPKTIITPFAGGSSHETCAECSTPEVWTTDSRFLLYRTGQLPLTAVGIFNVETGDHKTYLSDPAAAVRANSITRDGKWLLFTVSRSEREYSIYAAPFSVTQAPPRNSWIELLRSPDADANAVWTTDGGMVIFSSSRDGFNCIWGLRVDKRTKRPEGNLFAIRHFHFPSLELVAPSSVEQVALGPNKIIISLDERSGSIWMMRNR